MPNYSLVINSQFKPFTYEELARPYINMTKLHRELEQQYAMIDAQAAQWDQKANAETAPVAHAQYQKFADDLRAQADELARNGIGTNSSYDVYNMLARYQKEIKPIEEAYARQQQQIAAYSEAMLKDPTHFFEYNPSNMSLDKFLEDPKLNTLQNNFSGAALGAMVAAQAEAVAKDVKSNPAKWSAILGGQYYEKVIQKGRTVNEIFNLLAGNKNAAPEVAKMIDNALEASGMTKWSNWNDIQEAARAYALQGAWKAVGDQETKTLEDKSLDRMLKMLQIQGLQGNNGGEYADPNARVFSDIPIGGGGEDARVQYQNTLSRLGIQMTPDGSGMSPGTKLPTGIVSHKAKRAEELSPYPDNYHFLGLNTKADYTENISLYDRESGRYQLKTRHSFTAQGRDADERRLLGNYYDNTVVPQLNDLGIDVKALAVQGKVPTMSAIQAAAKNKLKAGGASYFKGMHIDTESPKTDLPKSNLGSIIDSTGGAYKITNMKDNYVAGERKKVSDILSDIDKNSGENLHFMLSMEKDRPGIIIQSPKGYYFVPSDNLPIPARQAYNMMLPQLKQYQAKREELINTYGEDVYRASDYGRRMDTAITELGDAMQKQIMISLFNQYKRPETKVIGADLTTD